jgi:hypothetical protein
VVKSRNPEAAALKKKIQPFRPPGGSTVLSCTADFVQSYYAVSARISSGRDDHLRVENPIAVRQRLNQVWPGPPELIIYMPRRYNLTFATVGGFLESIQTKDAACVRVEWLTSRRVRYPFVFKRLLNLLTWPTEEYGAWRSLSGAAVEPRSVR